MTNPKPRALLFSGQGAQRVGMGADLIENSVSAQALYELADSRLGWPLSDYSVNGPEAILTETRVCQPALYTHGLAILAAFEDHAGRPLRFEAAAGLSLGEYTAHAAAGTFTFQTGLQLVEMRGKFMQEACNATAGTMMTLLGATPRTGAGNCHGMRCRRGEPELSGPGGALRRPEADGGRAPPWPRRRAFARSSR